MIRIDETHRLISRYVSKERSHQVMFIGEFIAERRAAGGIAIPKYIPEKSHQS